MSGKESDMDYSCEFCNKTYGKKSILRHIGQSEACLAFYGPRFKEMKKKAASERKENYRSNLTVKKHKKVLQRNRILYANNPEMKERIKKPKWKGN